MEKEKITLANLWELPFGVIVIHNNKHYVYLEKHEWDYVFYCVECGKVAYAESIWDLENNELEDIELNVLPIDEESIKYLYQGYLAQLIQMLDEPFMFERDIKFKKEQIKHLKDILGNKAKSICKYKEF